MHDVIDSFFKVIRERDIKIKQISDEQAKKIIDEIIDDFKEFVYNPDTIISKDLNLFNEYDLPKFTNLY